MTVRTIAETPFDTDLGLDVRDEMHDLFADGVKNWAPIMLARWAEALEDPDDKDIVLLAMAIAAWDAGRVNAKIQKRALALLHDESAVAKRLRKTPPKPKAFKKRVKNVTALENGDLVALELSAGVWIALVVWQIHADKGGRFPIVDVIDWIGTEKPTPKALAKKKARGMWFASEPHWRKSALGVAGLRSKRHVIAKKVARPASAHLGPAIGLWTFTRMSELEDFVRVHMQLGA